MQKEVSPAEAASVRTRNRQFVLQLLRLNGTMSRLQLADATGLSGAAVSNVVAELVGQDFVTQSERAESHRGRIGRPPTSLSLRTDSHVIGVVHFGARFLQVGLCDIRANVLASKTIELPADAATGAALELASAALEQFQRQRPGTRPLAIGVAAAAGLGVASERPSPPGLDWTDERVVQFFAERFKLPVAVDHNVRAMALAESGWGQAKDLSTVAFIYARTGVGAGLVVNGRPYKRGPHSSVEVGHVQVVPDGLPCKCGRIGCLETVINDAALRRACVESGTVEASLVDPLLIAQAFRERLLRGDARAKEILDGFIAKLASVLAVLTTLLNPELIIVGGLLSDIGDVLIDPLQEAVAKRVMPMNGDVRIVASVFGTDVGLSGAGAVALSEFVFGNPKFHLTRDVARIA